MKKDLVLLVNADAGTEATVRTATAVSGQVLRIAKSAPEAFVIAATEIRRLALVILDLDPNASGLPLLTALALAQIPSIALTADHNPAVYAFAMKHRAVDCVAKPITSGWINRALDYLVPVPAEIPLCLAA